MSLLLSTAPIKAVFFDLYNTLARFYPPREELQANACRKFGIVVTPEGISRGYAMADEFMAQETARRPLAERLPEEQASFFAQYERLVLKGSAVTVDLATAGAVMQEVRRQPYDLALFDDVLPGLEQLRRKGLVLGLISNLHREGDRLLDGLGLQGRLDLVVTSRDAGVEKPHSGIFKAALTRAGVLPTQTVHVGDQLLSDVEGARRAGLHAVLMDRYGTASPPDDVLVVHNMQELADLLAPAPQKGKNRY